jgi:hypothetical protein
MLTLQLHLILDDEGVVLVVNLLRELGGNSMVRRRVLDNKTFIALDALVLYGLFNGPLANISPFLLGARCVLLRVRGLPSLVPVVGELLEEVGLDNGRL